MAPGGQCEGRAMTGSLPPIPHTEGPWVAPYSRPCCAHTHLVSISQEVRCSAASIYTATVATKTRFQKGPEGLGVPLLHLLLAAWNSQDCLMSLFSAGASSGDSRTAGPPHPTPLCLQAKIKCRAQVPRDSPWSEGCTGKDGHSSLSGFYSSA